MVEHVQQGGQPPAPGTVVVHSGRVTPERVGPLCDEVCTALQAGHDVVLDVSAEDSPTLAVVDALARLVRATSRFPGKVYVVGAGPQVRRLLHLTGLHDVVLGPPPG